MIDSRQDAVSEPVIEQSAGDEAIRAVVERLSRPHRSGGRVIERAAIVAEAADAEEILSWIAQHGGLPEDVAPAAAGRGLHSSRLTDSASAARPMPLRYLLPRGPLG